MHYRTLLLTAITTLASACAAAAQQVRELPAMESLPQGIELLPAAPAPASAPAPRAKIRGVLAHPSPDAQPPAFHPPAAGTVPGSGGAFAAPASQHLPAPPLPPLPRGASGSVAFLPTNAASGQAVIEELPPLNNWWDEQVVKPLGAEAPAIALDDETLVWEMLQYSHKVQALKASAAARLEEVAISRAAFDPRTFAETKYSDTSDPVTNTLQTGGPPRLNDNVWNAEAGLRKRFGGGGEATLSQQLGFKNSNSQFFLPNDQGSARLALNLTQPLLRGRGCDYNYSLIRLSELDAAAAGSELRRDVQDHLLGVLRTYWSLYAERSALLQRQRNLQRAEEIAARLEARRAVDAVDSQIVRVRSAVATRKADLLRASAAVRNAEARLRAQVNSPRLSDAREFTPGRIPQLGLVDEDLQFQVELALQFRPEIDAAFQQVRAAGVRHNVAVHELLPVLNLVVQAYVSGVEGDTGIVEAFSEQFTVGAPSYSGGLVFEAPWGNQAAKARERKRDRELAQMSFSLQQTLAEVRAEVEIAFRNLRTAHAEASAKQDAAAATLREVDYLESRWRAIPGDDRTGSLVLADLLDAHNRLLEEERAVAAALADYCVTLIELRRATGTLIRVETLQDAHPQKPPPQLTTPVRPSAQPTPAIRPSAAPPGDATATASARPSQLATPAYVAPPSSYPTQRR